MLNKSKIQQLIDRNEFNEVLVIIDNLMNTSDIDLEDQLVCWFLKSQVLVKTGKTEKGLELADKALTTVRNQALGNQLLLVDAIITKLEALRRVSQIFSTYSIEKLSGHLQLLKEGERILENILHIEPLERTERIVILLRIKGIIYRSLSDFGRAEKCFLESIVLHKKMGNKRDVIELLTDLAIIYQIKAEYDRQLEIFQDCLNLCEELEDREGIAESFLKLANVYQSKGDPENASIYVQRSLQLAKELPGTYRISRLLFNIGFFYVNAKYEPPSALDAYHRSLSIDEKLDNKDGIQLCLHLLGDVYQYSKGDLNRALEYYERSMAMFTVGRKIVHGWNLLDVGNLYHLKGDLDLALIHFQKALPLLEEIGDDFYFCQTFLHIGRVYRSKGDNHAALDYYKRCLKFIGERKLRFGQETEGLAYHELIAVMLDNKDIREAKKYFELFKQYYERQEQSKRFLNQWYKLSEALILKTSPRIKEKARAQQLFQEVVDDPFVKLDLLHYLADSNKTAMLNLCELLLFELKSSPDEITEKNEIFLEVKQLLTNLASLAREQYSFPLLIDVTILQAKLALIEGDLLLARQLLAQAKITAEENELQLLHKRVTGEENYLMTQLSVWENLIKKNAPLLERLAYAQIEDY
ncbi:MAG: tetratricopeptide repeat protein, partial [Candidatus Heimdallarchaeota archaeon]